MNLQNSEQVTNHLARLIKTDKQLSNILQELNSKKRMAIGRFDGIVEFKNYGLMTVPYFEQYASTEEKTDFWGLSVPIENQIAYAMRDYDAPFCFDEVQRFCDFFELDSEAMMKEAIPDERFDRWVDDEMRSMLNY
jgi:hypothetical protein